MPMILAGFAWLASFFRFALPWIVEQFAKWTTRRIAVAVAVVAAFVALTTAFYAAIYGIVSLITLVTPSQFSEAVGLFLPSNTYLCVSSVLATYSARWLYDLQLRVLSYTTAGAGF